MSTGEITFEQPGALAHPSPSAHRDLIRVVLADHHVAVRAGLKALLGATSGIEVVGEATNGPKALALIGRLAPDVAILDLDLPQMDGMAVARKLFASHSSARVLMLTMNDGDEPRAALLEAGVAGSLMKNAADRNVIDAVRAVASGGSWGEPVMHPSVHEIADRAERPGEREQYHALSSRERDVLVLVAGGYSEREIGANLFIGPKTVATYKQHIAEKLGLSRRADYVQLWLRLGLPQATS